MRLADLTLAFPGLLLVIAVMAAVGPGVTSLAVTIGIVGWAGVARVIRSQVLSLRERDYLLAARSLGLGTPRLLVRHLLPNCLGTVVVLFTMGLGSAIVAESSLSFLGLGVPPPEPSWGSMIAGGLDYLRVAPWVAVAPGVAITLAVLGFNLLGDGLRDLLDPTLSRGGGLG
jgi:peptide/nickel transport system permease protein/oligopeptide transport system permease protein